MQLIRKFLAPATFLFVVVLMGLAIVNAQSIEDWYRLRGYTPPAEISSIAAQDTMTGYGRHILSVTHPVLENDGQRFRQECSQAEQTIVLGCYHSGVSFLAGENALFVYNVKDERLHGVQQVTTAHEMLHAAYDRLGTKEKKSVDAMLQDFYNKDVHDQRIIDTINAYKRSEPNDVVNEMHSVFGTEIANLPAPLENYYKKYFVNRAAVVSFANTYEGEFTSRTNQIKTYDQQLTQLKQQINDQEQQLQSQLAGLESDRARVEQSNDGAAISQYNARISAYNAGVRKLQSDIATYNRLVDERNGVASELRSLQGSLDSRLTTQPAQ